MIKFMFYAVLILFLSFVVMFILWKSQLNKLNKLKKECEELTAMNDSYKRMQEVQTKERIELEKDIQNSVGTGSTDSFSASIQLMQKLTDKGKSRS